MPKLIVIYIVVPDSAVTEVHESLLDDLAVFVEPANCCMGGIKNWEIWH